MTNNSKQKKSNDNNVVFLVSLNNIFWINVIRCFRLFSTSFFWKSSTNFFPSKVCLLNQILTLCSVDHLSGDNCFSSIMNFNPSNAKFCTTLFKISKYSTNTKQQTIAISASNPYARCLPLFKCLRIFRL